MVRKGFVQLFLKVQNLYGRLDLDIHGRSFTGENSDSVCAEDEWDGFLSYEIEFFFQLPFIRFFGNDPCEMGECRLLDSGYAEKCVKVVPYLEDFLMEKVR